MELQNIVLISFPNKNAKIKIVYICTVNIFKKKFILKFLLFILGNRIIWN